MIPEDWSVSTVGAEFSIQLGKMLDAAKNTGVSKPYIGNRSVLWGRIDLADIDTVPMTSADLQRFRLRSGDIEHSTPTQGQIRDCAVGYPDSC